MRPNAAQNSVCVVSNKLHIEWMNQRKVSHVRDHKSEQKKIYIAYLLDYNLLRKSPPHDARIGIDGTIICDR